ncbi:hypothetical protein [Streptomyces californicus]|uniref:hypothetical protein n=1 Tax=Streptomyces californicus TaxID=67351 RepID=UPI0037F998D5
MAKCCGSPGCKCTVIAGPGVTVDGNGSPTTPYTISAPGAEPTALQAAGTPTVDATVTGTGTDADPFMVSAAVVLDPAPPQGGDNLLQAGADGLFLECADVRTCFSAGGGASYDATTGVITARPSTDAGNALSLGTDGGLFTPPGDAAEPTAIEAADSTTADTEITGTGTAVDPYVVTSSVILDPSPPGGGDQLLQSGPDGLFLECEQVRTCFSAGDGAGYDEATGVITARPSTDAGNSLSYGTDGGLLVPPGGGDPTAVEGGDSDTVATEVTGTGTAADPYVVTSSVILDPSPPGGGDQLLQSGPDGLFLECTEVRGCFSAGDGAGYDEATGVITARPSTDAGNSLTLGTDGGLLVPTADQLTVGCGLQGEGTVADPLAAFPIAGERAWSADWACDAAANSTLRCDPGSGALWTPPEHTSAAVTMQQLHPLGNPAMPATGTTVIIDSAAYSEGLYDADTLTACRGVSFSAVFTGHAEVSWTAGAIFDLAYAVSVNGGSAASRLMYSELTPSGPAGRRRQTFSVAQAAGLAPHTGYRVRVYPAIRVTSGTVTVNQWITDTHLLALTR